jgi:cytidylate kinase
MPVDYLYLPSVDLRIESLEEYNRKQKEKASSQYRKAKPRPCITISREFGCTGYPAAERLREIMAEKTGEEWVMIDKDIIDEVARRHNLSEDILKTLGEDNRLLDEILATFSPRWKSNYDYFKPLASHVMALAEQGNVIIVEMGGAVLARHLEHSWHFRIYGSPEFKSRTLASRLSIEVEEAEKMMLRKQKLRDNFSRDFLNHENNDPSLYHLQFNNDRCPAERIAQTIAGFVLPCLGDGRSKG